MAQAYKYAKSEADSLRYILRDEIINSQTNSTLYEAVSKAKKLGTDSSGNPLITTWTSVDEEFYAALGTPKGAGSVYLLKDYMKALERMTILADRVSMVRLWLRAWLGRNMKYALSGYTYMMVGGYFARFEGENDTKMRDVRTEFLILVKATSVTPAS